MPIFISDLHLSPERPDITQAFFTFLDTTAKNADSLYILGDFFDAWLGDDDDTPEFLAITERLALYTRTTPTFLMHGNRDFLIGEAFAQSTGVTLLTEPTKMTVGGISTLLIHGDSLCTMDKDYMAFRKMVRQPQWQQGILAKPLAERKAIAAQMRKTSQSMNSLKAEDIMDVTPAEVIKLMEAYDVTQLIHGHTHRPARHKLALTSKPSERIVLGDWDKEGWYLILDEKQEGVELRLTSFSLSSI